MADGYTKRATYRFTAGYGRWELVSWDQTSVVFEDVRSVVCGHVVDAPAVRCSARLIDGRWVLDECSRMRATAEYYSDTDDMLEEFLNEHGVPE